MTVFLELMYVRDFVLTFDLSELLVVESIRKEQDVD